MTEQASMLIRSPAADEHAWIEQQLRDSWGSVTVMSRGQARDASRLPALVAIQGDDIVGLATFEFANAERELVTLGAFHAGKGIGSALLGQVTQEAAKQGCRRLWLITTNNNLNAIRFYQRRGLRLVAVHRRSRGRGSSHKARVRTEPAT